MANEVKNEFDRLKGEKKNRTSSLICANLCAQVSLVMHKKTVNQ